MNQRRRDPSDSSSDQDVVPDSIASEAESGAITRGALGSITKGATLTSYEEAGSSTPQGADSRHTSSTSHHSSGSGTTGLLKGRLAKPHLGCEKYIPAQELGRGGMGVVHRALDIDLRRDVAMKVMLPDPRESKYARFIEEAQVTGQLEHPNIVPVHDLGIDTEGRPFFTMKLVDGRPLEELLNALRAGEPTVSEQWPLGRLLGAFLGICNGIAYAHEHGVVHRDLKPANIMLGGFGEVQVMDWGLAKIGAVRHANRRVQSLRDDLNRRATHRQRRSDLPPIPISGDGQASLPAEDANPFETQHGDRGAGTMTHDGSIMGTPVYMPPEQARGAIDEIDERSDIYSLGAILYEILTLKPPVSGDNARSILERVKAGRIIPPERRAPTRTVPPELSAIAMKALARQPDDRYQRSDELRHDVELFIEGRSVSAKEDTAWEATVKLVRRNKPVSIAVGIAALVLALTVTASFTMVVSYWSEAEASRDRAREALTLTEIARDQARSALADFQQEQERREQAERQQQALSERIKSESRRNWHLVHEELFTSSMFEHWDATAGWIDQPQIVDEAQRRAWLSFRPDGLHVRHRRDVVHLAYRESLGDSLRIVLSGSVEHTNNGGLHVILRGNSWNRGYIFQVGGWTNSRAAILRGRGVSPRILTETPFSLRPGRRYRIEAVAARSPEGYHLSLRVDGNEVLSAVDTDPLPSSGTGDCAVMIPGPAAATLYWAQIAALGPPLKENLLATADRHLDRGNHQTAFDLFQEVAVSGVDPERIAQARQGMERARELLTTADQLTLWRDDLRRVWHGRRWSLDLRESQLVANASGQDITDLAPLRGLPINRLTLYDTRLDTLEHLVGMPLTHLLVSGGGVRDLSPLRDLPLHDLSLTRTAIDDLGPLAGLPLIHLDLSNNQGLTSLNPLRGCPIETLILNGCQNLTDLEPLAGLRLQHLEMSGCAGIEDLHSLQGLPLRSLAIDSAHTDALIAIINTLTDLERITVHGDRDRPTGYQPEEFWHRYGIGIPFKRETDTTAWEAMRADRPPPDSIMPDLPFDLHPDPDPAPETDGAKPATDTRTAEPSGR